MTTFLRVRLVVLALFPLVRLADAQPAAAGRCTIDLVRVPDDVRPVIERWIHAEPRCNAALEVRVVPSEGGLYVFARDDRGRVHERVVPDATSAGVLIASWAADDTLDAPVRAPAVRSTAAPALLPGPAGAAAALVPAAGPPPSIAAAPTVVAPLPAAAAPPIASAAPLPAAGALPPAPPVASAAPLPVAAPAAVAVAPLPVAAPPAGFALPPAPPVASAAPLPVAAPAAAAVAPLPIAAPPAAFALPPPAAAAPPVAAPPAGFALPAPAAAAPPVAAPSAGFVLPAPAAAAPPVAAPSAGFVLPAPAAAAPPVAAPSAAATTSQPAIAAPPAAVTAPPAAASPPPAASTPPAAPAAAVVAPVADASANALRWLSVSALIGLTTFRSGSDHPSNDDVQGVRVDLDLWSGGPLAFGVAAAVQRGVLRSGDYYSSTILNVSDVMAAVRASASLGSGRLRLQPAVAAGWLYTAIEELPYGQMSHSAMAIAQASLTLAYRVRPRLALTAGVIATAYSDRALAAGLTRGSDLALLAGAQWGL